MSVYFSHHQITQFLPLAAVLLAGFYGGTSFLTLVEHNPAVQQLSGRGTWQLVDYFMAVRLKVCGPLLLLCGAGSAVLFYRQNSVLSFWLMLAALLLLLTDLLVALHFIQPLHSLLQSWEASSPTMEAQAAQQQLVAAFWARSACAAVAFAMVVLAAWQ